MATQKRQEKPGLLVPLLVVMVATMTTAALYQGMQVRQLAERLHVARFDDHARDDRIRILEGRLQRAEADLAFEQSLRINRPAP